jgi:NAD(P)H dehydrogenase (quinone)
VHTLVVVAHPDPSSLTHHIASRIADELGSTATVADLHREGFDPRFTLADKAAYDGAASPPADVLREQERLDAVTDLVLVFPVYWWSLPALLKGWIDRVFSNGWAFDYEPGSGVIRKLDRLRVHLVPVAGSDADLYDRHGYEVAIHTQVRHGILEYCGTREGATAYVFESETLESPASVEAAIAAVTEAVSSPR